MRAATSSTVLIAAALVLAGCGGGESPDPDPTVTQEPDPTPTEPAPEPEPEPEPTDPPEDGFDAPTDLAADTMLPLDALAPPDVPRDEQEGVVAWRLPISCEDATPADAVTMRTVAQGDGELEAPINVHQTAVFADADAASTEADRLATVLDGCEAPSDSPTVYEVEAVDVGTQGVGLVTDYNGALTDGPDDSGLGTYLAVTRRGNAVTLVSAEGGESTVGVARERVVGFAAQAWELLCRHDSAGC